MFTENIDSLINAFFPKSSATVAQEYAKFWVGIESPVINVVSRNVPIQPSYGITTRRPPFKQAVPNYSAPSNDQYVKNPIHIFLFLILQISKLNVPLKLNPYVSFQEQQSDPIYEGCGQTKTCFGFPDGCVATKDCRTVTTSIVSGERYEFELKSNGKDNLAYVAVALSNDDKMGDDSVMECVPENGRVHAYTSWTLPRPNLGVTRQGIVSLNDG